jgi:hypothetical protein
MLRIDCGDEGHLPYLGPHFGTLLTTSVSDVSIEKVSSHRNHFFMPYPISPWIGAQEHQQYDQIGKWDRNGHRGS